MVRKDIANKLTERLGNIRTRLHPMKKQAQVILTNKIRDQYGDTSVVEIDRVFKECILQKVSNIPYVSMDVGILLTDIEELPYKLVMTITGLPRTLNFDDMIKIGSTTYTISKVFPINRAVRTMIECYVYPERSIKESLDIIGVEPVTLESGITGWFIKYSGYPNKMQFDANEWQPIQLFFQDLPTTFDLRLSDGVNEVSKNIIL